MATHNPYAPPGVREVTLAPSTDRSELRKIATAQRQVNIAALLYLLLVPGNIGLSNVTDGAPWTRIVIGVMALSVFTFGAVSVYKLAAIFRGKIVAVVHAIGLLVPLLGLLLLLSNSQQATKILRENGIRVGLLGANPNSI